MTPQENQALQSLLSQLTQIRGIPKDPEAERMIAEAVARQPDAAYLLVQRSMLLDQALESAKAQIARLETQARPVSAAGSGFLDANAWGNNTAPQNSVAASVTGRPLAGGMSSGLMPPAAASAFGRTGGAGFLGGGSSMLGTLAATAAGVAGGAFLFHGIGNLLDQHRNEGSQDLAEKDASSDAAADNPDGQNAEPQNDSPLADNLFEDNSFADDGGDGGGSFEEG